jgi:hypothetical protein
MRIVIHNLYRGEFAEAELSRRLCLAAASLGWEAIEVGSSTEINQIKPDFVLSLHFRTPKLTEYPTYGCMWNPPAVIESDPCFIKNILTYDGYLSSSSKVDLWLHHLLYGRAKKFFTLPFYTSCNHVVYQAPNLNDPHLVYFGTNWDGPRFKQLFEQLDHQEFMQVYGKETAWEYLKNSYCGALPFDGTSVLSTLNQAGVGLCLHTPQHCDAEVPSMRIFEIVASGAIALCEPHPFIAAHFADSVLYIDPDLSPSQKADQIAQTINWIRDHPHQALNLSQKAHRIFSEQFALENLLLEIVPHHNALIQQKGFSTVSTSSASVQPICPEVEFIVKVEGENLKFVQRTLQSLRCQTYPSIAVIIVRCQSIDGLEVLLQQYQPRLKIRIIDGSVSEFSSTSLWEGLFAVTADYFAILNESEIIYPNHVHTLVTLLQEDFQTAGVAYSGAICITGSRIEDRQSRSTSELAVIDCFEPFSFDKMLRLEPVVASNSFIAKSVLLDDEIRLDPRLSIVEDLFLLLHLCRKSQFIFSYEVTCQHSGRSASTEETHWVKRLQSIFSGKDFPAYQTAAFPPFSLEPTPNSPIFPDSVSSELETMRAQLDQTRLELHYANTMIAAIQSSKFWKIRRLWFKLRKIVGLKNTEQLVP